MFLVVETPWRTRKNKAACRLQKTGWAQLTACSTRVAVRPTRVAESRDCYNHQPTADTYYQNYTCRWLIGCQLKMIPRYVKGVFPVTCFITLPDYVAFLNKTLTNFSNLWYDYLSLISINFIYFFFSFFFFFWAPITLKIIYTTLWWVLIEYVAII